MHQNELNHFVSCRWLILGQLLTIMALAGCAISQSELPADESIMSSINVTSITATTSVSPSVTSAASETPTHTPTPIPTTIPTLTPSPAPTQTVTETPLPSMTPTATSTPMPTLTPLPTIPPQQRGQVYTELMSSNGNCTLPCWWGFELGKASIDEVRQFYTAFDTYVVEQAGSNGISVLYTQFVDPQIENGTQVGHTFIAKDGIVTEALIEIVSHPDYQIGPILERLGQPSEV